MGAVYQGTQVSLNRLVAIKLLPAEFSANADFMARFQREAQTLASLSHSGIVTIYDFGTTSEGHLYFVMEFIDGTDLAHAMHTQRLAPNQALELTMQICEALHYAHSQGVVHRDIKPANVLLTRDGRAKLADFGLARPLSTERTQLTASHIVMGSPDYMAPEQWQGKADHRADIYALGVMLYEMLTGSRPQGAFDLPSIKAQVDARLD
jgi:serine/threonine protein kinase